MSAETDMRVAGEADDGEKTAKLAKETKPDIILLDLKLPKINRFELTRRLRGKCKVIALTSGENTPEADISAVGAIGCLHKNIAAASLANTIRQIKSGGAISPADAKTAPPAAGSGKKLLLTAREMEILQLISRGMNNRDIASELYLSEKTLKNHLTNMFKKLKVHDRTQALLYALKSKMVLL